jgi:hypothetical protein
VDYFDVLSGKLDGDSKRNEEDSLHGQPVTLGSACSLGIKAKNIITVTDCSVNINNN